MRWALYAAAALLAAALVGAALFPLSLALSLAGDPIEGVPSGTVWRGHLSDARIGGRPLGRLTIRTSPTSLLSGAPEGRLAVDGPSGSGTGRVAVAGEATRLRDIDARLPLSAFDIDGPFGAPIGGTLAVRGEAVLGPRGCEAAALTLRTDMLEEALSRLGRAPIPLAGRGTCENGTLVARLAGRSEDGTARAQIRLRPGRWVSELTLDPADPRIGPLLTGYGFRRTDEGFTLVSRGVW